MIDYAVIELINGSLSNMEDTENPKQSRNHLINMKNEISNDTVVRLDNLCTKRTIY